MHSLGRTITSIFFIFGSTFLLSACGGGGGGSSSDGSSLSAGPTDTQGVLSSISLTGDDTIALGESADVNFYAFRQNFAGSSYFLSATSSASALNFVRVGMGELEESELSNSDLIRDMENSVVFNVSDVGVSIRINKNGEAYLYSVSCYPSCPGVEFDLNTKRLTLVDVVLTPTIGGDSESQAAAFLTINGTISWKAADEDPSAPAANSGNAGGGDNGGSTGSAQNIDPAIVGNWNATTDEGADGIDEFYIVINSDGTFTSYDYEGDSFDMGDNCYHITNGRLEPRGGNEYDIYYDSIGRENPIDINMIEFNKTIYNSGESLIISDSVGTITATPSTIPESSYDPEC